MLPYQIMEAGYFTSDSTNSKEIPLSCQPDLFWIRNRTAWGDDAAETSVESWWRRGMAAGSAQTVDQAVTSGAMSTEAVTIGGFTFVDTSNPPSFTALAGTAVTAANPAVVSMADTGSIVVGDTVRMLDVTNMQQISGLDFTVTAVTTNVSITLGYLDASGFAAPGTTCSVLKFIPSRFYPRYRRITKITQASQAVVTFSTAHDFTPGEIISFRVPSSFGMEEINNQELRVLSTTASTVTLDYDSSGNTAFAFPTSAVAAAGVQPAVAVPSSSGVVPESGSASNPQQPPGTNLRDAFDNRNKFVMLCGANVITSTSAVYDWVAYKFDKFTAE